jgi:DEAD/DEAH box helicase domain-containing protein
VHEGAIYLHEGQQYLVEEFDWNAAVAKVRAVDVDYVTEASASTRLAVESVRESRALPNVELSLGDVRLTTRVTGFRKIRLDSLQHLGWGVVDLPERHMVTTACWLALPDAVVARLAEEGSWTATPGPGRGPNWALQRDRARLRDGYRCVWCGADERPGHMHDVHHVRPFREFAWAPGENDRFVEANALGNLVTLCPSCHRKAEQQVAMQSTLSGLGRVIRHLLPLFLLCDSGDVGIHTESKAPQTGLATLFVYDNIAGGIGLSDALPSLLPDLLARSRDLVSECACTSGCPSCIGAEAASDPQSRARVLGLVDVLMEGL